MDFKSILPKNKDFLSKKSNNSESSEDISSETEKEEVLSENQNKSPSKFSEEEVVKTIFEKLTQISKHLDKKVSDMNERLSIIEKKPTEDFDSQNINNEIKKLKERMDKLSEIYEAVSDMYNPLKRYEENERRIPEKTLSYTSNEEDEEISDSEEEIDTPEYENEEDIQDDNSTIEEPGEEEVPDEENDSEEDEVSFSDILDEEDESEESKDEDFNDTEFEEDELSFSDILDEEDESEEVIEKENQPLLEKKEDFLPIDSKGINYLIGEKEEHLKRMSKNVSDNQRFFSEGFKPFSNILELLEELNNSKDLFNKHVGKNYDQFADWIENSLGLRELSEKLREIKDREDYILTILSEI